MKGMCQTCGAVAPIEWFLNEPVRRQFEAVLVGIPKAVQGQVFHYLALFRPLKTGSLTPKKALRLLNEVRDLAATGYVSKRGLVDRPCPPHIWAEAMEIMTSQRHSLTLPMPNHKYLCKVAYDRADQADRIQESGIRKQEAAHTVRYQGAGKRSEAETPGDRGQGAVSISTIDPLAKLKETWDADK